MAKHSFDIKILQNPLKAIVKKNAGLRKWMILACVAAGSFMSNLENGFTNIALPTLSAAFSVPIDIVQWVVSAYLLTICALLPIVGKLSDLLGRYRLFMIGFLVFSVGSALCALSISFTLLVVFKVMQAIGAALVLANTMGIATVTFGAKERGKAIGLIGVGVSLGSMSGPALGGMLIEHFGWRSIFWLNVPFALLGFAACLLVLPKEHPKKKEETFDYFGAFLFIIGITVLVYSILGIQNHGWLSGPTLVGFLVSFVILGVFYYWENNTSFPILDFSLYRIWMFLSCNIAALITGIALMCVNIMMPFFLQYVMHVSPGAYGYVMAAYPLALMLVAPFSGWLSDRIGSYALTSGGLLLTGLGFVSLNFLTSGTSLWIVVLCMTIFGIGLGLFQAPNNSSIMGSVPQNKVGLAGGLSALTRNLGLVLGVSISVSLFSNRLRVLGGEGVTENISTASPDIFMGALHTVFWTAAFLCVIGAAISLTSIKGIKTNV